MGQTGEETEAEGSAAAAPPGRAGRAAAALALCPGVRPGEHSWHPQVPRVLWRGSHRRLFCLRERGRAVPPATRPPRAGLPLPSPQRRLLF